MSNTDGEDTQPLLSNLAKLDKIASKEVSRWHEKSNKRLGEQLRDAEKDLASLREQLEDYQKRWQVVHESNRLLSENESLKDKLKQKEDENRELLIGLHDLFDPLMVSSEFRKLYPGTCKNLESLIHKHKKNLSA